MPLRGRDGNERAEKVREEEEGGQGRDLKGP